MFRRGPEAARSGPVEQDSTGGSQLTEQQPERPGFNRHGGSALACLSPPAPPSFHKKGGGAGGCLRREGRRGVASPSPRSKSRAGNGVELLLPPPPPRRERVVVSRTREPGRRRPRLVSSAGTRFGRLPGWVPPRRRGCPLASSSTASSPTQQLQQPGPTNLAAAPRARKMLPMPPPPPPPKRCKPRRTRA